MVISVFNRVENSVGKGEIACTSNFSFFHNVFKRLLPQTRQKVSLCVNGLNELEKAKVLILMGFFEIKKKRRFGVVVVVGGFV